MQYERMDEFVKLASVKNGKNWACAGRFAKSGIFVKYRVDFVQTRQTRQ